MTKPTVRLKDDHIILKLCYETCELIVTDDMTDDAIHFAHTIQSRIQEVLDKRRRKLLEEYQ